MRKVTWFVGLATVLVLFFAIAIGAYARVSTSDPEPAGAPLLQSPAARPLAAVAAPGLVPRPEASPPAAETILQDALTALAGLDSWHLEAGMDVIASFRTLGLEAPVSYTGDFRAPDRLEGTVSWQFLGVTLEKETVLMANTMQDVDSSGVVTGSMFSLLSFGRFTMADVQNLELIGEETLDGTQVYHLSGQLNTRRDPPAPPAKPYSFQGGLQFEIWIGVADSLPRQITADGQLSGWGPAEGTLQIGGSARLSDFGQPVASGAAAQSPSPGGTDCQAVGAGFVAYRNERQHIGFCYPEGWVVDDLVATHGFIALSPDGVGYGHPLPKSLLVFYPPAIVRGFGTWQVGAVEVLARPPVAFYNWIRQTLQPGEPTSAFVLNFQTIARIGQWLLSDGPLIGGLTGSQGSDMKAVSVGGTVEGDAHGSTVEAILSSVVVGDQVSR